MQDYQIVEAKDIDKEIWDKYIVDFCQNPCYLFYSMRFVIESEYDAKTLLLIAKDSDNKAVGVLFSYHLNKPGNVLYTPEFGVNAISENILLDLMDSAKKYSLNRRISKLCLTTGYVPLTQHNVFDSRWNKYGFILNLSSSSEQFWSSLSSNSRNKIRKAKKNGVTVVRGLEYFDDFYKMYADCYLIKKLNLKSRKYLLEFLKSMDKRANLFVCLYKKKVISGAIFVDNCSVSSYLFNASCFEHRGLGANDLLIWEAGKYYVKNNIFSINLGESKQGSGAYQFKQRQLKASSKDIYYYALNSPSFNKSKPLKLREKIVILLCRASLPAFILKKLLIKRNIQGRFI